MKAAIHLAVRLTLICACGVGVAQAQLSVDSRGAEIAEPGAMSGLIAAERASARDDAQETSREIASKRASSAGRKHAPIVVSVARTEDLDGDGRAVNRIRPSRDVAIGRVSSARARPDSRAASQRDRGCDDRDEMRSASDDADARCAQNRAMPRDQADGPTDGTRGDTHD